MFARIGIRLLGEFRGKAMMATRLLGSANTVSGVRGSNIGVLNRKGLRETVAIRTTGFATSTRRGVRGTKKGTRLIWSGLLALDRCEQNRLAYYRGWGGLKDLGVWRRGCCVL